MKKISNKGFVLAETIVVAVFMVTIFSVLYSNYYPIMANYEKREYYDDIDSKYVAFWLKYMLQDPSYKNDFKSSIDSLGYTFFSCDEITNSTKRKACIRLTKEAGITENPYCKISHGDSGAACSTVKDYSGKLYYAAIITPYNILSFKETNFVVGKSLYERLSDGFIDYINFLPDYNNYASLNGANYRLIIELYDNREPNRTPIYKYATIEVTK